jgi:inner membrane protein
MNSIGHVGITLAAYAPLGGALVATDHPFLAAFLGIGMVVTMNLPDVDHQLSRTFPFVKHRGLFHSVFFPLIIAPIFTAIVFLVWSNLPYLSQSYPPQVDILAAFAAGAVLGPLSHYLGDIITPRGLRPFAPIWDRKLAPGWVKANNDTANASFFFAGISLTCLAIVGPLFI